MTVVIIDYGAGNLKSIVNMLNFLGEKSIVTNNFSEILNAERIIFPGQGNFAQAMQNLQEKSLVEPIKQAVKKGIPFLGICLGLQILFEESEEAPNVAGLGILKGKVKKYRQGKTPQIGWNKVSPAFINSLIKNDYFYFVNSFYVIPQDKNVVFATSDYHGEFCCAIKKDNLLAVQFHPEKSSSSGQNFFRHWLSNN